MKITLSRTGVLNSVASGLMFGSAGASASFVKSDTTTQGTWTGVYGADGYGVLDSSSSYPSYAQVTAANQATYVWNPATTDVSALQTAPSSSSRIAACYYSAGSFSLDVNITDGMSHQVALYMIDWDTTNRAQTVQLTDSSSNAVLDTRTVSNFSGGQWLVWNIRGHVKITLSRAMGLNAVASGLMFGA